VGERIKLIKVKDALTFTKFLKLRKLNFSLFELILRVLGAKKDQKKVAFAKLTPKTGH